MSWLLRLVERRARKVMHWSQHHQSVLTGPEWRRCSTEGCRVATFNATHPSNVDRRCRECGSRGRPVWGYAIRRAVFR